jgi:uncharacterized oligopeptide transporter (OPT) family protein
MEQPDTGRDEHQYWLQNTYQGNKLPEFTTKALIAGGLVGALLMASNVYVGLKTGFLAGGSILAAILSFIILRSVRQSFSVLENNIAQTVASAAGTLGIVVIVPPALTMLGHEFSVYQMFFWLLSVGLLGVLFAIPLRRQSIVVDKLRFPSGTACASTITAMHADAGDAVKQGKVLGISGFLGSVFIWFKDAIPQLIPSTTFLPGKISGVGFNQLMVGINWSPLFVGVGMLIGPRIGISLFLGVVAAWGIIGPMLIANGVIETAAYPAIRNWTMWPAIGMMVAAGITTLLMRGRIIFQTFRSMRSASFSSEGALEFPFGMWLAGVIVLAIVISSIMQSFFQIPVWMTLLAIPLAFILTSVAVRTYGETDVNPVAPMGWTAQITFGALSPGNTFTNVIGGGMTAATANAAGDMMGDLKTGYLLGATPRRQTYAQLIGVIIGMCVALPVFYLLTSVYTLGGAELPAPAGISWSGLANVLAEGFKALPPYSANGLYTGILLGVLLTVGGNSKAKWIIPSPLGIGIAMILPATFSLAIVLGSVIAVILKKASPRWWENYSMPLASGLIAGEAVFAIIIIFLRTTGIL